MSVVTRKRGFFVLKGAGKMDWNIREKIYEETKNMTPEEESEYSRKQVEEFHRLMEQVDVDDYDFSFLVKK